MVNVILLERTLNDIRANLADLKTADDITWDLLRTEKGLADLSNERFISSWKPAST